MYLKLELHELNRIMQDSGGERGGWYVGNQVTLVPSKNSDLDITPEIEKDPSF